MDRTVFGRTSLALLLVFSLLLAAVGVYAEDGTVTPSEPEPEPEGWYAQGNDRVEGTLEELISALDGDGATIYLTVKKTVRLKNIQANLLANLAFEPDPDAFPDDAWRVRVTAERPADGLEDIDLAAFAEEEDDVLVSLYIWAEKPELEPEPTAEPTAEPTVEPTAAPTAEPTAEPTADPTAEPTVEPTPEPTPVPVVISVAAKGYRQGEWMSAAPVFTLSGIPEGAEVLSYAVILFDERMEDISGETYTPDADGVFTLRFVILDEVGDIVSASEQYTLRVDITAPQVDAMPSDSKSYAVVVTASDSQSGLDGVSRDGGATWESFTEEGAWFYVAEKAETLAAGQLQVRDAAGNLWQNEEPIELTRVQKNHGGGGGGGPRKEHSSNTSGNDGKTNYVAAALTASEEPVSSLTLKEHALALTSFLNGLEAPAQFHVSFARWTPAEPDGAPCGAASLHTGDITAQDDTIVLTAVQPEGLAEGEEPEYLWRFDGALLRTLYSSGVDTLVLRLGDDIAILPTAGFTAGTRFTELKIAGTSSRYFAYEARMQRLPETGEGEERVLPEGNWTENCLFELSVDVEEQLFQLFPHDTEEMYAENVLAAPVEAMEHAMGAYPPEPDPAA